MSKQIETDEEEFFDMILQQQLEDAKQEKKVNNNYLLISKSTLNNWYNLLCQSGVNSKKQVRDEIKEMLDKANKE